MPSQPTPPTRQAQLSGAADDRLRVRSVHCGAYHTFLLTHTANVYACGLNNMGQLGLGSLEPNFTKARTLTLTLTLPLALTLTLANTSDPSTAICLSGS